MESTTSRPLHTVGTTLEADAAKINTKLVFICNNTDDQMVTLYFQSNRYTKTSQINHQIYTD